jgi:hypothetical protein
MTHSRLNSRIKKKREFQEERTGIYRPNREPTKRVRLNKQLEREADEEIREIKKT